MKITYQSRDSFLHHLNPVTKLVVLILFSLSIFLFDSWPVEIFCLLMLIGISLASGSRAPLSLLASRYTLSFTALLLIIQVIFTQGGTVFLAIPAVIFSLNVTSAGLTSGLVVALRFICVIIASAIFVFTTDPGEMAYSLIKAGLPYRYGFMLVTALRFIPVFESEASTVRHAQMARGLELEGKGIGPLITSLRCTLLPLVVSALSKVDALVISMEGRAFGYRKARTFLHPVRFRIIDVIIISIALLAFGLLLVDLYAGWLPLPELSIYNN